MINNTIDISRCGVRTYGGGGKAARPKSLWCKAIEQGQMLNNTIGGYGIHNRHYYTGVTIVHRGSLQIDGVNSYLGILQ